MGGVNKRGKPEVRRDALPDVLPTVPSVVAPIESSVILEEQSVRARGMPNDLVHALAEFRILYRLKVGA